MKVSVNYAYARPHKLLASYKALESLAKQPLKAAAALLER